MHLGAFDVLALCQGKLAATQVVHLDRHRLLGRTEHEQRVGAAQLEEPISPLTLLVPVTNRSASSQAER